MTPPSAGPAIGGDVPHHLVDRGRGRRASSAGTRSGVIAERVGIATATSPPLIAAADVEHRERGVAREARRRSRITDDDAEPDLRGHAARRRRSRRSITGPMSTDATIIGSELREPDEARPPRPSA